MPVRDALATARLTYTKRRRAVGFHVEIEVWSHSYDHPDVAQRNGLVTGVYLVDLPGNFPLLNVAITDRYGIDETGLWGRISGASLEGFQGYLELDTQGDCGHGLPSVLWASWSGIYDERCLFDPAVDAYRLQTYGFYPQIVAYNYMLGPLTFAFDVALPAPPTAVGLRMGHIGGNNGDPTRRSSTLPDEQWVIQFP